MRFADSVGHTLLQAQGDPHIIYARHENKGVLSPVKCGFINV